MQIQYSIHCTVQSFGLSGTLTGPDTPPLEAGYGVVVRWFWF